MTYELPLLLGGDGFIIRLREVVVQVLLLAVLRLFLEHSTDGLEEVIWVLVLTSEGVVIQAYAWVED